MTNKLHAANAKTNEAGPSNVNKIFPIGANTSSTKFNQMRLQEKHLHCKLAEEDYTDFRLPIQICQEYSVVMRPFKPTLRGKILAALGIDVEDSDPRITLEQFLHVNSFVRYENFSEDDMIWFCVKLLDPILGGYTPVAECERTIDTLFRAEIDMLEDKRETGEMTVTMFDDQVM